MAPLLLDIVQSPEGNHFTGHALTFSCITYLSITVDTVVIVSHSWNGPSGTLISNKERELSAVEGFPGGYRSNMTFNSLQSSDSGTYTCSSIISAAYQSNFITSSHNTSVSKTVNAGICEVLYSVLILLSV